MNQVVNDSTSATVLDEDRNRSAANLTTITERNGTNTDHQKPSPDRDDHLFHSKVILHSEQEQIRSVQDHCKKKEKCFNILEAVVLTSALVLVTSVFSVPTILFAIPEDNEVCSHAAGQGI